MACLHDHSCEDHDCSTEWSLYKHIDLSKVSLSLLFHFFFPNLMCVPLRISIKILTLWPIFGCISEIPRLAVSRNSDPINP